MWARSNLVNALPRFYLDWFPDFMRFERIMHFQTADVRSAELVVFFNAHLDPFDVNRLAGFEIDD